MPQPFVLAFYHSKIIRQGLLILEIFQQKKLSFFTNGLLFVYDGFKLCTRAVDVFTDYAMILLISPDQREQVTWARYSKQGQTYQAEGNTFKRGLFEWEQRLFSHTAFPTSGRILIGGAGGGREADHFLKHGYQVVAFEPSDLCDSLKTWASADPACFVEKISYQQFTQVLGTNSPLFQSFDAIVVGWGSFAHILEDSPREAFLLACKKQYPAAPIALSYLARSSVPSRLRTYANRFLADADCNIEFKSHAGFLRVDHPKRLEGWLTQLGFDVLYHSQMPYGHILIRPANTR